MADRLPSDHPSIETVRARVERHGGGKRLAVPEAVLPANESVVRVVVDEETRFARLGAGRTDARWIVGLYETSRAAADPSAGTNQLESWLDEHERTVGSSVEVDVIEQDYCYGLREPGTRTVYRGIERSSTGLDAIASDLVDDGSS